MAINRLNFGAHWQNVQLKPCSTEKAAAPQINFQTSQGKGGQGVPAAAMTVEEAMYGKPRKKHTLRNVLLTALGLGALTVGAAKLGTRYLGNESSLRKIANPISKGVDDIFRAVKNKVTGWKSKGIELSHDKKPLNVGEETVKRIEILHDKPLNIGELIKKRLSPIKELKDNFKQKIQDRVAASFPKKT